MPKKPDNHYLIVALTLFIAIIPFQASSEAGETNKSFKLIVNDGRIDIHAENASFKEILKKLENKTGIKVNIIGELPDKKVILNIRSLPLYAVDTLPSKMSLKNYSVVYDHKFSAMEMYILPEGQDISPYIKGKTSIRRASFSNGKKVETIKGKEIVSTQRGQNNAIVRYVKDEILLKFHMGVTDNEIDEILKKYNLVKTDGSGLSKVGYIKATIPDGRDVISVIKEIRKEYKLKIPEPNYIASILTSTDPLYSDQWYIPDTNFDQAWEVLKNNTITKVAVIDSGIYSDHPDLKGKILEGYNFVAGSTDVSDDNGHGTFVAGIIAAAHNEIGIKGLYDYARIIPVKVIDENGIGTYEDAVKGIVYAADNGATVINLSIGGYGFSYTLQDAVDYALEKGCIVVAAGGNDGIEQEFYPAAYQDVIGVSALSAERRIWPYSNSGRHIDISAPGDNIISTGLNENYVYASGTSASAAMVSALAAMLIAERADLSISSISRLIAQSAKDLGETEWDKFYGSGEIDGKAVLTEQVNPFHDVAVRSVYMEPTVFEKEKSTYIVTNIENIGTYYSETCDIVFYEVFEKEKKEIGKVKGVTLIYNKKVLFELVPEKVNRNIQFEISIDLKNDMNGKNNTT